MLSLPSCSPYSRTSFSSLMALSLQSNAPTGVDGSTLYHLSWCNVFEGYYVLPPVDRISVARFELFFGEAWRTRRLVMAGKAMPVILPGHGLHMIMLVRSARVLFDILVK